MDETMTLRQALEKTVGGEKVALYQYELVTADDARAVCEALRQLPAGAGTGILGPLNGIVGLFARVRSEAAAGTLREEGTPLLAARVAPLVDASRGADDARLLLFGLRLLAWCRYAGVVDLVVRATRQRDLAGDYLWLPLFGQFAEGQPARDELFRVLAEELPGGFCAVAFLDAANQAALNDGLRPHPFDRPAGYERLEAWLTDADPEHASYAVSATASLPFMSEPARGRLLALAMDHAAAGVQIEAAWAAAKVGSEAGVKMLARLAADVNQSAQACAYLAEVGREDAVPPEARDPDFRALAEMAGWLAHPSEFGRAPDEIALYDTRELYWPPAGDVRRMWLVRYVYREPDEEKVGVGAVGSVTFALFSETTADQPPEDIYALHCCWELEMNGDPRAPEQRSVEAGRKLLSERP